MADMRMEPVGYLTIEQGMPLSMLPAGRRERWIACAVALVSAALFALIIPFADRPLPRIDAFIPFYQSAVVVGDLITAVFLFGQFGILRSRALLVLAAGYLFTAFMAVVHALTFPGLFAAEGLLGAGADSTAWIYMFWHSGFPLAVIFYARFKDTHSGIAHAADAVSALTSRAIWAAVMASLIVAVALTWLATSGGGLLPAIMQGGRSAPSMIYVISPVWSLSFVALLALGLRRRHSVLDVWLMVSMCAWIFEIALSAVFNGGRFTLGYYAGRIYGLGAAGFILIVLLFETSTLYARLARSFENVAASLEERTANLAQASEILSDTSERLTAAFMASPAAFIALDTRGNVLLWNPAAERIFGWKAEEVIGNPYPVVPDSERAHFNAHFERATAGETMIDVHGVRMAKDGRRVEVNINSSPLHDQAGLQTGVFYVVNDVTGARLVERQLQQAQKMEVVGQLTGGLAHDFNNLLGIAIGNLDMLEERVARDSDATELLQAAVGACLRGAQLTRQLLAFSRQQPLSPESIDPVDALKNMTRLLGRTLGEQVTLRLQSKGEIWPIIADRTQLETAVLNLAINARDAMPQGGTLSIEPINAQIDENYADNHLEVTPGDYVEIAVTDTGTGMAPEILARVFEPFFTTKETGKGTGLGLSMVYGFIKQSGGHIKIYSEIGQGTTVKLWLPRAPIKVEQGAERVAAPTEALVRGNESVLVVEDNPDIRKVALRQLDELGYRTLEASDADAALALLKNGIDIDLLFTDVVMPGGKDGPALAREALTLKPGIKVLFTSGFTQAGVSSNGKEPLSAPLLSKPYRKQQLATKLREVLDG